MKMGVWGRRFLLNCLYVFVWKFRVWGKVKLPQMHKKEVAVLETEKEDQKW